MWSLEHPVGYLMHLPLSRKELKIGRNPNSVLCIATDRSISKHHAKIIVYPNNKIENNNFEINNNRNSICEIIDYGSKYHTYIIRNTHIKLEPGKSYQLEPGDKIKFGMGENIWTLKYYEIGLLACGYCNDNKINIVRAIESIGGTVYNECNKKCTHFVTMCKRVTSKFVFALSSGLPITDKSYWQAFMCAVKNDVKLPNPLDYPVANDIFKNEFKDVVFYPVNERKNLFDGLNFIFFNVQQCNNYGVIIKAAGGRPHIYHKSSFDPSELVEPDIIIIECTETQRNNEVRLISDGEYDEMELFLSKSKKRMINCKEIISAILFCSINKYCNPMIKSLNKYWRESPKKKLNRVREKSHVINDKVRDDNDGNLNKQSNLNSYPGDNNSNDFVVIRDQKENEKKYNKQINNNDNVNREPKSRNLVNEKPWIDTKSSKNSDKLSQLSLLKSSNKLVDRQEEKKPEAGVSKICEQVCNNVPKIRDKSSSKSLENKQNEDKKINNKRKLEKREAHELLDKDNKRFNSGKSTSDDDILVVDDLRDKNQHSDNSNLKNANQSKDPEVSSGIKLSTGQLNKKVQPCKNKSHNLWDDESQHLEKNNLKNANQSKDPEISRVKNDKTQVQNDDIDIVEAGTSKAHEEVVVDNSFERTTSGQFKNFLHKTSGMKSSTGQSNKKVQSCKNKSHNLWDDESQHLEKNNLKNGNQSKDPEISRATNDKTQVQNDDIDIVEAGTQKADEELVVDSSFESITDETTDIKSPKEKRYNLRSKKDVNETNSSQLPTNAQSVCLNEMTLNQILKTDHREAVKVNQEITDSDKESNLDENDFETFTIDNYSDEDIKVKSHLDLSQPSSSDSPDYHVYVTTQADVHLVPNTSSEREASCSPFLENPIDDDDIVAENNIKPNFNRSNDNNLPKFFFK